MAENNKKSMTIDDLAVVMQAGFAKSKEDNESLAIMVGKGFSDVNERIGILEHQVKGLNANVNNYLELSEKRYSELKQRDALLAKWIKLVAEKTGVPVDVSQLEKI